MFTFERSSIVSAASTSVITSPVWMPLMTPSEAISAPPANGAITMGTRLRIDCSVKPIARRSRGRASPMTAKIAGDAMLCQAMTNASPRNRNGQDGLMR